MSLYPGQGLDGTMSSSDFLLNYGNNAVANQTPWDVADNGQMSQDAGSATVTAPTWLQRLTGIVGTGLEIAGQVRQLTGRTTAPPATTAQPAAQPAAGTPASASGRKWVVIGIVAAAIAAVIGFAFFRRK